MNSVIRNQVVQVLSIITDARAILLDIQDACSHEDIKGEYKANTGNWCESDDSYWIVAHCQDCSKSFHADSVRDKELYRKLSMSGSIK